MECERYFQYSVQDLVTWISHSQDELIRLSALLVQLEPNSCSHEDCLMYQRNVRIDIEEMSAELERKLSKG